MNNKKFTKNEVAGMYSTLAEMCNMCVDLCNAALDVKTENGRRARIQTAECVLIGFIDFYIYRGSEGPYFKIDDTLLDFMATAFIIEWGKKTDDATIQDLRKLICKIGMRAVELWEELM